MEDTDFLGITYLVAINFLAFTLALVKMRLCYTRGMIVNNDEDRPDRRKCDVTQLIVIGFEYVWTTVARLSRDRYEAHIAGNGPIVDAGRKPLAKVGFERELTIISGLSYQSWPQSSAITTAADRHGCVAFRITYSPEFALCLNKLFETLLNCDNRVIEIIYYTRGKLINSERPTIKSQYIQHKNVSKKYLTQHFSGGFISWYYI